MSLKDLICKPILSERELTEKDFADRERIARVAMPQRPAEERRNDFEEVNLGLSPEAAMAEAKRCLECGCHDYHDCRLIRVANALRTDTKRLRGAFHPGFTETKLVSIECLHWGGPGFNSWVRKIPWRRAW